MDTPSCVEEPEFDVGRTISWAPDGKTILTIGTVLEAKDGLPAGGIGIVRYKSEKPFSPNPADWNKGEFVSPVEEAFGALPTSPTRPTASSSP